jgi:hypothetical protein
MSVTRFRARRFPLLLGLIATLAVLTASGALATHGPETEVSAGNDGTTDVTPLQNKQNEPIVAINPANPTQVAAGQNDNIDLEGCAVMTDNTCPFTDGVGVTGFEGSLDGGLSFTQPNYTGYSTRHCKGVYGPQDDPCTPNPNGPIGTVPRYDELKLVSDGDPVQTWGPRPGADGRFSWANGARLYYEDLTSHFNAQRDDVQFRGFEAIAVSYTDSLPAALTGNKLAWSRPVIISNAQSQTTFSDKNWMAADDATSSPFFGYVHACWVSFRSFGGAPEPVMYSRSTDGGNTWGQKTQLTSASNTNVGSGRQGCQVDTDSDGVVYVFFLGGSTPKQDPPFFDVAIMMTRSFDGGVKWERPRPIATVEECGRFDVAQGRLTFDGVAGARTNSFPSVSIANGAPAGNGPDTIYVTWCDGPTPTTGSGTLEEAKVIWSTNQGNSWNGPVNAALHGDRPDFPALAVSPDGTDVYLTYMAFHAPWQSTTAAPRTMEGVVVHANANPATGAPAGFGLVHRGASGDARGSTTNNPPLAEFLGDYNSVDAENDFAVAVWNDVRFAGVCPTMNAWRQARVNFLLGTGPNPGPQPSIATCPQTFGNSDIWGARIVDPTP